MLREFDVIKPSNEAELGEDLRSRDLYRRVLLLIALERMTELDARRLAKQGLPTKPKKQRFDFRVQTIDFMDDYAHLLGDVLEFKTGKPIGTGRLQVEGEQNQPQNQRRLGLYVVDRDY